MRVLLISLILLSFNTINLFAAEASVTLQLSSASVVLGEDLTLDLIIKGNIQGEVKMRKASTSTGIQINWTNSSRSNNISIVNGRTTRENKFSFSAKAIKLGQHNITPIVMDIGGKLYTSNSVSINITKAQKSNHYLLQTSLSKNECFLGETIDLHIDYLFSVQEIQKYKQYAGNYELANVHYAPFSIPSALNKSFHIEPQLFRSGQGQKNIYFGTEISQRSVAGFQYRVHRITFRLEPKKVGRIRIPSFNANFFSAKVSRHMFGGYQVARNQRRAGISQPLNLNVQKIPNKNIPDDFTDLITDVINIELKVLDITENQKVQLHSPIAISLHYKGNITPSGIKGPNWDAQTKLLEGFNVSYESMIIEENTGGFICSEITIRPKRSDIKEIPPISISYFNPNTKVFNQVQSKSFKIIVEDISMEDKLNTPTPRQLIDQQKEEKAKQPIVEKIEGLEKNLTLLQKPWKKNLPWNLFFLITVGPWGLYSIVILRKQLLNLNKRKRSNQKFSSHDSIRKLDSSKNNSESLDIFSKYISHNWKVTDPSQMALSNEALKNEVLSILEAFEAASYSSSDESAHDKLTLEAKNLISKLAKERLN